jgi:hypothetical protein
MRQCTTTQTEEQQVDQGFTPSAALALGRAFRFVRQAREMTLREAAKAAGVSVQYVPTPFTVATPVHIPPPPPVYP